MTNTPHELHEIYPESAARIHELKLSNPEFAALAESYRDLNRLVHRMDTGIEPVSADVLEEHKKRRLALLDQIAALLNGQSASA